MTGDLYFLKDTFDGGSVNFFEVLEKEFYYNFSDTPYIYKGVTQDHAHLLFVKLKGNTDAIYSNLKGYKMKPIVGQDFLTNKEINTEHLDSEYLLVNFWGSWCVGCMQDKPDMIEAYNKLNPKKVKFLGIATDNSYKLSELLKSGDMPWPQILNTSENNIVEKNNIQGFPTYLLIGRNGVIISNHIRGEKFYDEIIKSINAHEKKLSK